MTEMVRAQMDRPFVIYPTCAPEERSEERRNNHPEERQRLILEALRGFPVSMVEGDKYPPEYFDILSRLHDGDYLDFLAGAHMSAVTTPEAHWEWMQNGALIPDHYVRGAVDKRRIPLYKQAGIYANDWMTPIYASTYDNAMKSGLATYTAAGLAGKWEQAVYTVNSSPGHHARRANYGGYCFLNNGAIAAEAFRSQGLKRGVVLDLDYHAGDGTQALFYSDPDVLTISLHADPARDYPSFSGFEDETGEGEGEGAGFNRNFVLPPAATWETYRDVLTEALELIGDFKPDFLVIPFGGDTFKGDPDASPLSRLALEVEDYTEMGRLIARLLPQRLPTVVTQEGGYNLDNIGAIVHNFLAGLCARD